MALKPIAYDILPKNSIRVLTLLPGSPTSELRCELCLLSSPSEKAIEIPFEALSYTWGEPVFPQRIFCDQSAIPITQNLFEALMQLRREDTTRRLWIDAICINQQDLDEKSKQIPLMKDIYRYAAQVIIWLGLADESTSRALAHITLAADCLRRETRRSMPISAENEIIPERFDDAKNCARGFPSKADVGEWESLVKLFERKWFSRCWVFQESVLATAATVRIGQHELDWTDLCVAARFFSYKSYAGILKDFSPALSNVFTLCSFSRIGSGTGDFEQKPLMDLLEFTHRFQATEPKDRIFALLGLALAEEEAEFPVDYNISLKDLYTNVSRFLLCQPVPSDSYPLRVLASVKHYPDTNNNDQFPSWVKRFHDPTPEVKEEEREEGETQPMFVISACASSAKFFAGGTDYPGVLVNPATPYEISFEGFVFATISHSVNFLRMSPLSRSRLWDLVLDIRSVREDRHTPYPTGENIDEAFALTLTMADTIILTNDPRVKTYHAIDFQHFCVSIYEQTIKILTDQGRTNEIEHLNRKWEPEYQELRSFVKGHIKSPRFSAGLQLACRGRKLFSTIDGYIGIGDVTLQPGDLVCVLFGGKVPFILRPIDAKYMLVGECYLHGIMLGEALEEGRMKRQRFTII